MSAAAPTKQSAKATPLEVWLERVEARALLVSHKDMTLVEAVDVLQESAVRQGLVKEFGQDQVQRFLSEAFREVV
jgi:hypothetical protein